MTSWHSYPSIFNVGHRALEPIVGMVLQVEEKIDGSQFSFGRFDGELKVRSKGKEMFADAPEKMFAQGVEAISKLDLRDGWTYRGEYLQKPKHNALTYSRIPNQHVILFDINTGDESYLSYEEKQAEAARIGLECVPLLHNGPIDGALLQSLLDNESILGGTTIEGVVLKQYSVFGQDKKVIMGKYVSEMFKEKHTQVWGSGSRKPANKEIIDQIVGSLATPARWNKSIQHLRDNGELENDPRDIGKLLKEIGADTQKEEADWIKDQLFKWAWPQISRGITREFPQYYKETIASEQLG